MPRIDTSNVANNGINGTTKQVIEQLADRTSSLPEDGSSVVRTTVTVGDDFTTFHEAMKWACYETPAHSSITIMLPSGIHEIGEADDVSKSYGYSVYNVIGKKITLYHTDPDAVAGDIILSNPNYASPPTGVSVFDFLYGASASFYKVQFQPEASGYGQNVYWNTLFITNSIASLTDCRFIGWNNFSLVLNNSSAVSTNLYMDMEGKSAGPSITNRSYLHNTGVYTVINSTSTNPRPLDVASGAIIVSDSIVNTGNSNPPSIPFNEIQYDGSYIADGTAGLSFKA